MDSFVDLGYAGTGGTFGLGPLKRTAWGRVEDLLSDRNFQSLLAGVGAGLDPTGAGGAIGVPTQQLNRALASQEATKEANLADKEWRELLTKLLRMKDTDKTKPGRSGINISGDQITMKGTLPKDQAMTFEDLNMGDLSTSLPAATGGSVGGGAGGNADAELLSKYMSMLPF